MAGARTDSSLRNATLANRVRAVALSELLENLGSLTIGRVLDPPV
jgi:hypothetical protein